MAKNDGKTFDPRKRLDNENDAEYAERMAKLDASENGNAKPHARARLDGESDADYAERMQKMDDDLLAQSAAGNKGNARLAALHPRERVKGESDADYNARMERLDTAIREQANKPPVTDDEDAGPEDTEVTARSGFELHTQHKGTPVSVRRGQTIKVTAKKAARLARLGLVQIGGEPIKNEGPAVTRGAEIGEKR